MAVTIRFIKNHEDSFLHHAIHNNDVPMLKYITITEDKLDVNLCILAATYGSLEVLQYLVEKNIPCDWRVRNAAVDNNHTNIIEYLNSIGCSYDSYARL